MDGIVEGRRRNLRRGAAARREESVHGFSAYVTDLFLPSCPLDSRFAFLTRPILPVYEEKRATQDLFFRNSTCSSSRHLLVKTASDVHNNWDEPPDDLVAAERRNTGSR